MANKPISYVLHQRTPSIGKYKDKAVHQAMPTGRKRVDFRTFCDRVAKSTTFNAQEVAAVLNYATEIAKDLVANGDIVEFGDLGTLTPSFKSVLVPVEQEFNATKHITKPRVLLRPNHRYFSIDGAVSYERVDGKASKKKAGGTASGGSSSGGSEQPESSL